MQPNFPHVLGWDGAGTVEEAGDDVRNLKRGDRVYGINFMSPKGGFYAEYTAIKANNAAMIPQALSTRDAGVLAIDGVTALDGLDKTLQLKAGESILILGASGGIGHLAVQLAKRMNAGSGRGLRPRWRGVCKAAGSRQSHRLASREYSQSRV